MDSYFGISSLWQEYGNYTFLPYEALDKFRSIIDRSILIFLSTYLREFEIKYY